MKRRTPTLWAAGILSGSVVIALALAPALLHAYTRHKAPSPGKLVVHEWGTFTSFAGSRGVNLEFRPLVTNDLPRFIMRPGMQPGSPWRLLLKEQFTALERMETPVTYFYTDVPRVVNVRVEFPQGMLTEWYPVVKSFEAGHPAGDQNMRRAYLDWGAVRLTPPQQFAGVRVRDANGQPVPASLPPVDAGDHYGRARETDSAIVETVDANRGSHFEKFLFYRGLGNFELPIKLVALGNARFQVTNSGDDASGALFLVRIDHAGVRFLRSEGVSPHAAIVLQLPDVASTVDRLGATMTGELTAAGLYDREARAMVNTWRSSWFGENGTRLLYLVPGPLTDKLLPLALEPAPDERARVLVGRVETLTPEDCQRLVHTLAPSGADATASQSAIETELALLGRFAEPALQLVIDQTTDPSTRGKLEAIRAGVRLR
jgi:hypothetical protein